MNDASLKEEQEDFYKTLKDWAAKSGDNRNKAHIEIGDKNCTLTQSQRITKEFWMSKLALEKIGLPENIITIISDITSEASRSVLTSEGMTDEWMLECGVPQGEVLSPLRFVAIMDILAIWLAERANGKNPMKQTYGYALEKPRDATRNPGATSPQKNRKWLNMNSPPNIFARFFCDDIILIGKSREEVQDMLGVINEFMRRHPEDAQKTSSARLLMSTIFWFPEDGQKIFREDVQKLSSGRLLYIFWIPEDVFLISFRRLLYIFPEDLLDVF
ncbi:hypothetical protein CYMTET_47954 [Cymbomonas tetramitiformis]|uniref:Reverse transcriptase domain-containing protein n=1 Tax=Cymbomonas tetramitiformis TaxID=36881 RepID=A0AAE0EX76_9CHLO|nr:hypothetical protein CYMTET_47954 [Cymbomonas tetramitiformis]